MSYQDFKDKLDITSKANSWAFREAESILKKINYSVPKKGFVLFETGYGPSGLPHIGTFGEVVRTTIVKKAFEFLSDIPTRLYCFSDDMDALRKIPDNIKNKEEYHKYLGLPLTKIPDPYNEEESFGHQMNKRMMAFLDKFGFEYEFKSATEYYLSGKFNDGLIRVLEKYDEIMEVMLPTLGEERQRTYSPFLPICKYDGVVLQVPIIERSLSKNTITYLHPKSNELIESSILNGNCKLQWKPDFGMRWFLLDVDFEMYGKDHLVNGKIYSRISEILGNTKPQQSYYELFLDKEGQKISKSKGNGLSIEEWLRYAPKETLAMFMYINPTRAKKLSVDIIPKCADEYLSYLKSLQMEESTEKTLSNPAYHVHTFTKKPDFDCSISYSLILNLVIACNSDDKQLIKNYLNKFGVDTNSSFLGELIDGAINYFVDLIKPNQLFHIPSESEKEALKQLKSYLISIQNNNLVTADEIQNAIYNIAKDRKDDIKGWFLTIYKVLLGFEQGPRLGTFFKLYGIENVIKLLEAKGL